MMFNTYFQLGIQHITDLKGLDHIIFLLALIATFQVKSTKTILFLVTSFTIGHFVTLALAAMDLIVFDPELIEKLIAITIFVTAIQNLIIKKQDQKILIFKYVEALFFGLIHGMGFSGFFKSLLGKENDILMPLLYFNLGIEAGQILILAISFLLIVILENSGVVKSKDRNIFLSGGAIFSAFLLFFR
jgi:hypothetical protein